MIQVGEADDGVPSQLLRCGPSVGIKEKSKRSAYRCAVGSKRKRGVSLENKKVYTCMFISVLFIMIKTWK